jgi:hypothetical protein
MQCTAYAHLNGEKLKDLQAMEKEFGTILVAYEPVPEVAHLSESELQEIKVEEEKIGKILVAYEKT